tara:strand:- start:185 stop:799 length:615 start_codon:yes stop_codon:yes gene_type:complete
MQKAVNSNFFIHESSFIDDNVTIGKGTKVWHFCHILSGSKIGEKCSFGQNCVVGPDVEIGDRVKVQNNISIYKGLTIEDDVFLGPSMVFTNVINPRSFIERKEEFKATLLKQGCSIGANATIVCGITVGAYSFIGAGSVVTKDVPDFALIYGAPARVKGWVSLSGNPLEFDTEGIATDNFDQTQYQLLSDNAVKLISENPYHQG